MVNLRPEILSMAGYLLPDSACDRDKAVRLDTNENPYICSPAVQEAIYSALRTGLRHYPDPTATKFRRTAARVLGFDPEWILCGNGSDDILSICIRGFTHRGDTLRLATPSYQYYDTLAGIYGLRIDEVHFRSDWSLPEQFSSSLSGLRLAILTNPNSPSGTLLAPSAIEDIAKHLTCPLLIDEAYAELAGISCLELVSQNENILVSRSMSKSYALAGIRFGYLVAQPHVIKQLAKVKEPYNCDVLSIAAATAAIADQDWLVRSCSKIHHSRERVQAEMQRLGFEVTDSQANFIWCRHAEISSSIIYEQLKQRRVLVRHLDYEHCEGLRVSIGTDDEMDYYLDQLQLIV